jgi:hypothetical protein
MESMDDERLRKVAFGKEPPTPTLPPGGGRRGVPTAKSPSAASSREVRTRQGRHTICGTCQSAKPELLQLKWTEHTLEFARSETEGDRREQPIACVQFPGPK